MKEGETSPPKRYNSGSMILAMENAGQLIEDEELRAQIKGSGIGTSATRAEILKKLIHIKYLSLNKKTQIITPTLQGEMVYDVVNQLHSFAFESGTDGQLGKGTDVVAEGEIIRKRYMQKLDHLLSAGPEWREAAEQSRPAARMFMTRRAGFYKTEGGYRRNRGYRSRKRE